MKKHLHRLTALVLAAVLLLLPCLTYGAEKNGQILNDITRCKEIATPPEIASEGAVLIDAVTGVVLYGKNADVPMWPASITKLMTALLTYENCQLDDTVTFSYRACHELDPGATSIARTEGEEMSVQDCLNALLMMSANEVAQGLAEHVGGTIEDFADLMNSRAKELGCTDTHFVTPSGLHKDDHVTTCLDMARIMRALIQEPDFLELESHDSYTIPPTNKHKEETPLAQKHALVHSGGRHYEGALAGKTGYTVTAGHSLVTYAIRGDLQLICVVMKSTNTHYDDTRKLLDYGFKNFTSVHLTEAPGATDFARGTIPEGQAGPASLEYSFLSDQDWLTVPRNTSLASLTGKATLLEDAEATQEGVPMAKISFYQGKILLGTATLMMPTELPVMPETESAEETPASEEGPGTPETFSPVDTVNTQPEETEPVIPKPTATGDKKADLKAYAHYYLVLLGAALHRLGGFLLKLGRAILHSPLVQGMYQKYGFRFVAACIGAPILLVLVLILIHKLRKKFRKPRNPFIEPRNSQNHYDQQRKKRRKR